MKTVGVKELKNRATQIVREVREEGEEYLITVAGEAVAELRPVAGTSRLESKRLRVEERMRALDNLAAEIAAAWKSPLSAVDAIREQRRTL